MYCRGWGPRGFTVYSQTGRPGPAHVAHSSRKPHQNKPSNQPPFPSVAWRVARPFHRRLHNVRLIVAVPLIARRLLTTALALD